MSTMGLEAVVAKELTALGYTPRNQEVGRTHFQGDAGAICRANLWLRTAGRVLIQIGAFAATDFGELFDQTFALPWEEWIPGDGAFPVKGRSNKSTLFSVPTCQKIVKKAVAEKTEGCSSNNKSARNWSALSGGSGCCEKQGDAGSGQQR